MLWKSGNDKSVGKREMGTKNHYFIIVVWLVRRRARRVIYIYIHK